MGVITLINLLEKLGVNTRGENIKTKNVAAVMVTATLPAFSRSGSRISVNLSTLGDAKSLKGGTLLATPLMGLDGMIYAVAQGQVSIGKLSDTRQENFKSILTSGYIMNGALVEKEIHFKLNSLSSINIALKNPDITTARIIANAINSRIGDSIAKAQDPGTISLEVPAKYQDNVIELLADIENITVTPHTVAKIVIDEATGTVVVNKNVQISKVAIAQKNLIVKVTALDESGMEKRLFPQDETKVQNPGTAFKILEPTANLTDLVQGLNSLGVKPQDLIVILKSIQQAGALQAVIEVR